MFVLKNYRTKSKTEINEEFIRNIILNNFAEFKSFAQVEGNYEIKGKNLHGIRIPQLLFSIEDSGLEILKFKAVDYTGKGIYDFEIIVK